MQEQDEYNLEAFFPLRHLARIYATCAGRRHGGTLLPCDYHVLFFLLMETSHINCKASVNLDEFAYMLGLNKKKMMESFKRLRENRLVVFLDKDNDDVVTMVSPYLWYHRHDLTWSKAVKRFDSHFPTESKVHSMPKYIDKEIWQKRIIASRQIKSDEETEVELDKRKKEAE